MSTEAEINEKLGDNISTNFTDAMKTAAGLRAESMVNAVARDNFSDWFAGSPNADVKGIFSDIVSSFIAIEGLRYKPTGQDGLMNRIEFEDKINVLRDGMLRGLSIIRDKKAQTFIRGEDT
ncbi:MAG: hypothetical protein KJI72_04275 [Patescibacteria group bacterium]|nr:hypothetical protein [Patescibacteria group bacterium]